MFYKTMQKFELILIFNPLWEESLGIRIKSLRFLYGFVKNGYDFFLSQASFQLRSKEKDTVLRIFYNIPGRLFHKKLLQPKPKAVHQKTLESDDYVGFGHSLSRVLMSVYIMEINFFLKGHSI